MANEPKWTPGSWELEHTTLDVCRLLISIDEVNAIEIHPAADRLYVIAYLPNDCQQEQQAANAQLLSQSTEMYAGLVRAVRALRFASTPEGREVHFLDIAKELDTICAKARGESPDATK